jgi:hypothetical protein
MKSTRQVGTWVNRIFAYVTQVGCTLYIRETQKYEDKNKRNILLTETYKLFRHTMNIIFPDVTVGNMFWHKFATSDPQLPEHRVND